MSCILTRSLLDNNLEMIQPLVQDRVIALFVFLALSAWCPSQESDWTEIWCVSLLLPSGTYVQSFGSIVPAQLQNMPC
jgi:hypothetical protein